MNSNHLWRASVVFVLLVSAACSGSGDDSSKSNANDADGGAQADAAVDSKDADVDSKDAAADAPSPTGCTPIDQHQGTANPSALYCADMGYQLDGDSCRFPDGTQCNAWEFYYGQCGQTHSFCELHGGTVTHEEKATPDAGWTASYAVCTLPSGNRCWEQDFAHTCACEKLPF